MLCCQEKRRKAIKVKSLVEAVRERRTSRRYRRRIEKVGRSFVTGLDARRMARGRTWVEWMENESESADGGEANNSLKKC